MLLSVSMPKRYGDIWGKKQGPSLRGGSCGAATRAVGFRCLRQSPTWTSARRMSHLRWFCNVYLPTLASLPVKSARRVSSPLMPRTSVDLRSSEVSEAAESATQSWEITTKSTPSGTLKNPACGWRAAQPRSFCCKPPSRCLTVTG